MSGLITYERALEEILVACSPVGVEWIPLASALGRIPAEAPVVSDPMPPFASSAMDGFAVRRADLGPGPDPIQLPLDAAVPAGTAPPPLRPGHSAPIATGGPVPHGADAIVPIELAERIGDEVRLPVGVDPLAHVRDAGSDLPVGATPVAAGVPLDAASGALLAAIGSVDVQVYRRPKVTILATGSELVGVADTPGPAQIRDSNTTALAWAHTLAGADVTPRGAVPDDARLVREALEAALDADLVVTCAGVSVGELDLVRAALADLGVRPLFWGVDLKPGKPVAFGVAANGTPVISLPGNPASALVCSTLLAEPATRARAGVTDPRPRREHAVARGDWPAVESRLHAVRCALAWTDEGLVASPTGDQRSHRIGSMVGADGLALLPPGAVANPGDRVQVVRTR